MPEDRFRALTERLAVARERRAVLEAEESRKEKEREVLITELAAEGVDVTNLEGEFKRIQSELQTAFIKLEEDLTAFEKECAINVGDEVTT